MKWNIVFGSVGMALVAMASAALAGDKTKSEQAFDRLSSLKGEWKGETGGVNTTLIYTLTANGSALIGAVPTGKKAGNDYAVHSGWRSSDRHPLLLCQESAADGDIADHRRAETARIFSCPRYRPASA